MNINATLFAEMVVFATFVALTLRYIWPPLLDIIDQRQAEILEGVDNAEKAKKALAQAEAEKATLLKVAQKDANDIIAKAEAQAQTLLAEAKAEGTRQKDAQVNAAQDAIKQQIHEEEIQLEKNTLVFLHQVLKKVMVKLPQQEQLNSMIDQAIGEVDERH